MSKYAARTKDVHLCPFHLGGPILPASPTVFVGGAAAARLADPLYCNGPTDAVAVGSSGVFIEKLLAARYEDTTAHGGVICAGAPNVQIGEAQGNVTMVKRGNVFIIVDRDRHRIFMIGVQEFSGPGASQTQVDRVTKVINNTWSGNTTFEGNNYTVESMITGRYKDGSSDPNPVSNQIEVVKTTRTPEQNSNEDPAVQSFYGRGSGYQHENEDSTGLVVTAHEFGHAMGLPDEYYDGPRNPDGTRNIVRTGPKGGLMGYIEGSSRPTADNYNSIITGEGLEP